MGKLTKTIPYGSPYDPKNSDVGTYSNHDVDNWTVDFEKIDISQVQNVLGESATDIDTLSKSSKINPWALFRPDYDSPHGLDEFAGYNHKAKPTTYFHLKPNSGNYSISYSNGQSKVTFAYPLKRGERPPSGSASWEYVRLKAVVSGDFSGTFYSEVKPATTDYENHSVTIDLPDRADRTLEITFTGQYVSSSGSYIKDIEDSSYTIIADVYYEITYKDAPSELADNGISPDFRHYYTAITDGVTSTIEQIGTTGELRIPETTAPLSGLLDELNLYTDTSGQYYTRYYSYTVVYTGGKYYKIDVKANYREVGEKYQINASSDYDGWHKVNNISSGYNFWHTDETIETLSYWPSV